MVEVPGDFEPIKWRRSFRKILRCCSTSMIYRRFLDRKSVDCFNDGIWRETNLFWPTRPDPTVRKPAYLGKRDVSYLVSSYQSRSRIHCSGKQHEFRSLQRVKSTSDTSIPTRCWVTPHLHLHAEKDHGWNWNYLIFRWKLFILVGKLSKNMDFLNSISSSSHLIGKIVPFLIQRKRIPTLHFPMLHMRISMVQASLLHGTTGTDVACLPFQPR